MAQHRRKGDLRVGRVDDHRPDLPLLLPDLLPIFTRICRFVYAITCRDIAANVGLSGADIDYVWIRWRDRD